MEYRMLGPLEIVVDGSALDLGPHKQRSLLALLLINANRTVTTDRILEEIWGDEADGKENALWVYISRLRSAMENGGGEQSPLLTKDHGYSLVVDPPSVDVFLFETAVASGRAAMKDDPKQASETLRDALELWRGDALSEFRYDEFAQGEINRLDELRVSALEDRIEADLRLGAAGELIAELDVLTAANPLRERPVSLKMMALYRAGRQAEALRAFEQFRKTLGEEMGLEPSPELAQLEEQILLHDTRLQTRMRSRSAAAPTEYDVNPFKGLQPFQEADADQFFGRDRLVAEVVRRISEQRMVTLVGPSGSGKSSVVRAGVVPAIRKNALPGSDEWLIAQMVPGSHPFAELEAALLRSTLDAPDSLAEQLEGESGILRATLRVLPNDTSKILIAIDQFEELFTLVDDEATRSRFLDGLTEVLEDSRGRVMVLLTLRADFYERPLQYPVFGARLGEGIVNVVPMTPDELEQAADEPAARAGVSLEPALLASLLGDVVGQPGALPLFQYTLTELFDRRSGTTLDLEAYEEMGGLRGTLTLRADELFAGLDGDQQAAARQLFLRLVAISDTNEWSRRRVAASEIIALDVDIVDLKGVIDAYGGARLLTFDRDHVSGSPTVEVAHEALLTEWERLREWIDEARDDVRIQARLAAAGTEWRSSGENPDYLLSGSRLDEFEAWAALTTLSLTVGEHGFLNASVAEREAIAGVEQERVAREVALGRRAKRHLWGLAAAIVLIAGAGLFFVVTALVPEGPTVVLFTLADDESTFDEAMKIGLADAAREFAIEESVREFSVDPVNELRALAGESPDLIVMDAVISSFYEDIFREFPDVRLAVVGADDARQAPDLPNVASSTILEAGGSYLMGVAAALKTTTGKVGFVSVQAPEPDDFLAGFVAGVEDTDSDVEVLVKWIGTTETGETGANFFDYAFNDAAPEAEVLANELIGDGADVIFHVAGVSGRSGVTAAVVGNAASSNTPLWVIGVDADQFAGATEAEQAVLLTSMLKRTNREVFDAIEAFVEGRFTPGVTELDVTTGHVGFSPLGDGVAELLPRLQAAEDAIIDGSIVVPQFIEPIPGWPSPDVTIDIVFDGEACVLADEAIVAVGDTVTFVIRNESDSPSFHFVGVDDTGLTVAAFDPDLEWTSRVRFLGARFLNPGGRTQIHARATRSQLFVNCFDPTVEGSDSPVIIPVG